MKKFTQLKGEIDKIKRYRGITNADIGKLTGYSTNTIDKFMGVCPTRNDSEAVARAIVTALNIDYMFDNERGKDDNG